MSYSQKWQGHTLFKYFLPLGVYAHLHGQILLQKSHNG